jgi:putative ABC transport system permease protein
VQATDGHRAVADLIITGIVKPYLAGAAYMELETLGRVLREPGRINAAHVLMDRGARESLGAVVKRTPEITGVSYNDNAQASMRKMLSEGVGLFAYVFILFSSLMAAGVAYSAARVTFAEQQRDLATLRVLGFSRAEASYVLLAEIGALLLVALPLGTLIGSVLARWLMAQFQTDLFVFPYVSSAAAYGRSMLLVVCAVVAAVLAVRRGIDRLDLVEVLKSRE